MAALPEILLLVGGETRSTEMVRSSGVAPVRLRILRWDRVRGEDFVRRDLRAVVFEPCDFASDGRRRQELLSQIPEGVARVSLARVAGRAESARRRGSADLHLAAPVDLRVLTSLLNLGRRCRELEEASKRSRRVAGQLSRHLKTVGELLRLCSAESEPRRIVEAALAPIQRLCPVNYWSALLVDSEKSCLVFQACGGQELISRVGQRLGMGEGAAGKAMRSRSPLLVSRGAGSGLPEIPEGLEWREMLALPLISRGKAVGVVELIRSGMAKPFRRRDVRVLSLMLEPVAVCLENVQLLRQSEELSVTDDLTKLYNSRYLYSCLLREVHRARRYRSQVSLIFLDLDGFKNVNDRHGHLAGSRALVEVGAVIRNMVREIDVVCRYGGDEFTVILPQTGPEGAHIIADRIRCRLEETVFLETFSLSVRITASFGIASFPNHTDSEKGLIQKADEAMYRVKGSGKNAIAEAR
jgi:diguanylate cyclase (GGDEF)-like protein